MKSLKPAKIAVLALMVTLSMMLSYLEHILVLPTGIPGIKLGLSNLLVVFLLYLYGWREAGIVNLLRILLSGLLFGNAFGLLFSLSGAALSFIGMVIAKRSGLLGQVGVSVLGGVLHNVAQLIAAAVCFSLLQIRYFLPYLLIAGLVTGLFNGAVAKLLLSRSRDILQGSQS